MSKFYKPSDFKERLQDLVSCLEDAGSNNVSDDFSYYLQQAADAANEKLEPNVTCRLGLENPPVVFEFSNTPKALRLLTQAYTYLREVDECGADDSSLRAKVREWVKEMNLEVHG